MLHWPQLKKKYPTLVIWSKTFHDGKISDIEKKYFITSDYNKFTRDTFSVKIREKKLVDKSAIAGFIGNDDLIKKVGTLATKVEIKAKKGKIIKLQALDSSYFCGKSHFEDEWH